MLAGQATRAEPPSEPVTPGVKPSETDLERTIRELEAASTKPEVVAPSRSASPVIAPGTPGRATLLREGTFLLNRRGRLAPGPQPLFAFDPDAEGRVDPPMLLLPCEHLGSLQHTAARAGSAAAFIVSGQVFVYRGRNLLLLTRPAQVVRVAEAEASTTPATSAKPSTPPAPAGSADAQRTMSDLESAAPAPPATLPRPRAGEAERPRIAAAYREGAFIASRRARLSRGIGGALTLVFDSDSGASADAPLLVMPCANLMALEDLSARGGDGVSISVSGPVYTHLGQSFLLPTMYVVQPRTTR